jgi:mannose-6-phosphate isomerase-like protein (cupin superfamily)
MRSLGLVFPVALSLLIAPALHGEEEGLDLGEPLVIDQETPIESLLHDPEAYHGKIVKISGRIASVCTQEGCFIEVVPRDGGGEGIVVNFPGLAHTFPVDCAGLEAEVEGRFYQKVYPRARVEHWQHHSFREGERVPEYSLAFRMDVGGARIGGNRAATPTPAEIREASADTIDLAVMEFEAEGLGIGRRTIAPGGVVPRPSTGGNRWLVVCLEGSLVVHRADRQPLPLADWEMTYIPAGVVYDIRNEGDRDASFLLVYAEKIEAHEPEPHDH